MRHLQWCLTVVSSFVWLTAMAGPVSKQQAQATAQQWMLGKQLAEPVTPPVSGRASAPAAQPAYYVFNATGGQGFVVVSGDDRAPAVLGYSRQGSLDPLTAPASVRWWLSGYEQAIAAMGDDATAVRKNVTVRPEVRPLVRTAWGQFDPYNSLCPTYNQKKCLTGCVATAMAQVVNYHRWPTEATTKVDGYTTSSNKIKMAELPPTIFNWNSMSTEDYARLNLYCGQSVQMDYGPDGSGANTISVNSALVNVFGYDKNIHFVKRSSYGDAEWEDLIYNELEQKRPVVYGGRDPQFGGHCFICDGYDGNGYFHMNWGWDGWCDTFFLLTSLTPDTGDGDDYTSDQQAVLGVQPPTGNEAVNVKEMTITKLELKSKSTVERLSASSSFTVKVYGEFTNTSREPFSGVIGYRVYQGEEPVTSCMGATSLSQLPVSYYAYDTKSLTFGSNLSDGTYRIVPVYRLSGSSEYVPAEGADVNYIECVIEGMKMTLTLKDRDDVTSVDDPVGPPVDPTEKDEMWWGYFNGTEELSSLGTGQAETFDAAIYVPAGNVFVSNSTIKAVRLYIKDTSVMGEMKVWISTHLPDDIGEADYVQTVDVSTLVSKGTNDIPLNTPYSVGGKGVYVGYTVTITQADYVIVEGGDNVRNSLWIRSSKTVPSWGELTDFGKLALMIQVEGSGFPKGVALPMDFKRQPVPLGGMADVPVRVMNGGCDAIESLSYTVTTNGITSEELTLTMSPAIPYGATEDVMFVFAADQELGMYEKTLTITKVNGRENAAYRNTAKGKLQTVAELKYWPHTVLVEEFFTEFCGYCPQAEQEMSSVLADYPELAGKVAIACHHVGHDVDWLTVEKSSDYLWFYNDNFSYAPAFMWDRKGGNVYTPVMGMKSAEENKAMIEERLARQSAVNIVLTADFDDETGKLTVTADCERGYDFSETPARITVFVTEDNVAAKSQANAPLNYVHQHVVRAIDQSWGTVLSWDADKASYSCTFDVGETWKKDDLKVIAFVSNYDSLAPTNCGVENTAVVALGGTVQPTAGDVNGDETVDVGDVMAVINIMAGQTEGFSPEQADVNKDGLVDVGDVMAIINIMAGL